MKEAPARANNPLLRDAPPEVNLARAPLAAVICQIRFPTVASIARQDFIAPFQERLRQAYPILRAERAVGILLSPEGLAPQPQAPPIWRLSDQKQQWRLSLAPDFLALETKTYQDRNELLKRFSSALEALEAIASPAIIDRVGLRYVNIITGSKGIDSFLREEMRGVSPLASGDGVELVHGIGDFLFRIGEHQLRTRWGQLPANTALDPAIDPPASDYVLFDLDMFRAGPIDYSAEALLSETQSFAERIYSFFRWAVRDDWFESAKGQP